MTILSIDALHFVNSIIGPTECSYPIGMPHDNDWNVRAHSEPFLIRERSIGMQRAIGTSATESNDDNFTIKDKAIVRSDQSLLDNRSDLNWNKVTDKSKVSCFIW